MYKYISEILAKFSMGQRIFALIILLVAIVAISIGPKVIESLTYDDTELSRKIEVQKIEIKSLDSVVSYLNKQIIENQKKCTDDAVKREKEIIDMINEIQQYIKTKHAQQSNAVEEVYMKSDEKNDYKEIQLFLQPKEDEKLNKMIMDLKKVVKKK